MEPSTYFLVYVNNNRLEVHLMSTEVDDVGTCLFSEDLKGRDAVVRSPQLAAFHANDGIRIVLEGR